MSGGHKGFWRPRALIGFMGLMLMIIGVFVLVWFYAQNQVSMNRMTIEASIFMDSIMDEPPERVLEGNTIAVLYFPTLENRKVAVKEGSSDAVLAISAGHLQTTDMPWDKDGNCVVSAHNNTFFKGLKDLGKGDKVLMYTRQGVYEYVVYGRKTIESTDLSVLEDVPGQKILTLITCDFTGIRRIVLLAEGGVRISDPVEI